MTATKELNDTTFERLLHAAIEVFAERGFRAATVREICARANVNIASVNYYFRSKEALYSQALALAIREANELYPSTQAQDRTLTPEQRLTGFIDNFLHKLLDDSQLGYHSKLITREIAEPTKAFEEVVVSAIVPQMSLLADIVDEALGTGAASTTLNRCLFSILGQCLMYKHSRPVVERLHPELIADDDAIQQTAAHIANFSVAALSHLSTSSRRQRP